MWEEKGEFRFSEISVEANKRKLNLNNEHGTSFELKFNKT